MKIGVVDIDTSHPQNWIPIERTLGHDVAGLWDGGSVHPPEYVQQFAADHGIPRVFESLEEMAGEVDCAIIHSCDWDTHVDKARPFVEAGKAVLIDKPMAGRLSHINQLKTWIRQGARITGGSSLRFCYETRDWLGQPESARGVPHTVVCGCGVDEFNYGIHAYSMLVALMGTDVDSAKYLGSNGQRQIEVVWKDGRRGILTIGKPVGGRWLPFHVGSDGCVGVARQDDGRTHRQHSGHSWRRPDPDCCSGLRSGHRLGHRGDRRRHHGSSHGGLGRQSGSSDPKGHRLR